MVSNTAVYMSAKVFSMYHVPEVNYADENDVLYEGEFMCTLKERSQHTRS